jgi:hypothetical protein
MKHKVITFHVGFPGEIVITIQQEAGRIAVADGEEMAPFVQTVSLLVLFTHGIKS